MPEGAPGGMAAFRNSLVSTFLFKACVATALQVPHSSTLDWAAEEESAVRQFDRPPARGVQFHAEAEPDAIVGQPVKHRAADLQVCSDHSSRSHECSRYLSPGACCIGLGVA